MISFEGKIVVVTGTANPEGIGLACVQKFLDNGAEFVWMIDSENEKLIDTVYDNLWGKYDQARYHPIACNIGDSNEVRNAVLRIIEQSGRIDVLVNNAAINIPGDIVSLPMETIERLHNINVLGPIRMNKEVIPYMREKRYGRIVNMSSANSEVVEPQLAAYGPSKGAIAAQTRFDAIDNVDYGIIINCVGPGLVHTGFNDASHELSFGDVDSGKQAIEEMLPMKRAVRVEEVANMVCFAASDLVTSTIGHYFPVDGGVGLV